MLQAMNTGHDGSMSTGHANSTEDMLSRLETMVLMAAPLPLDAIRKQITSALDIIIFLSRLRIIPGEQWRSARFWIIETA